jgi:hypothetical protein
MIRALALGTACLAAANSAFAETNLFADDQLRGFLDVRAAGADGETSWTEDGFGKTRFGGDDGDAQGHGYATGMLVWRPHLTWNMDAFLSLQADTQVAPALDAVEAYLTYRGAPRDGWRLAGRAGLMYPPVSLEHDGLGWTPTETITPSAINSWISEEVKVVGVEATARRSFGEQDFGATLGLFGYNDTSGTLLAARGWALGDYLPGVHAENPLPTRSFASQDYTKPTYELDGRVGFYARLEYRPIAPIVIDVSHYDNAGDRVSDHDGQTNWETRFTNIGVRAALGEDTRLLAQVMTGQTIWGRRTPRGYWVDVDFAAAYLLVAHDFGPHTVTGRFDYFQTTDRSFTDLRRNNDEDGWSATAAYQIALLPTLRFALEGLHVQSERSSRADIGLSPEQQQTQLQSSLKYEF